MVNAVATLFMVGVAWFVQVVHYPLFRSVGRDAFPEYHEEHSARTSLVVVVPMITELVSSVWLAIDPPLTGSGEPLTGLAIAGAALAALTWLITFAGAVPAHSRMEGGFDPSSHQSLMQSNLARTIVWTGHGVVVVWLLAQAA